MKTIRFILIALSVLILLPGSVEAQEVSVSARLDTNQIYLGDQIKLNFHVEMPDHLTLEVTAPHDSLQEDVEFLSRNNFEPELIKEGRIAYQGSFTVTSFTEGEVVVPSPAFHIMGAGRDTTITLPQMGFMVIRTDITPSDSTQAIFDIVPPLKEPVTLKEVLPIVGLLIIAAVLVLLIRKFLIPALRGKKEPEAKAPDQPAHIIAFGRLTALKREELWQKGEVKEYYSRISEIIRDYLDERYYLNTMEQTTNETLMLVSKMNIMEAGHRNGLKNILTLSDMVKFAKLIPDESDHLAVFDSAWTFVSDTRVKIEESENGTTINSEKE